jgi:hypothetical protein
MVPQNSWVAIRQAGGSKSNETAKTVSNEPLRGSLPATLGLHFYSLRKLVVKEKLSKFRSKIEEIEQISG